MKRNALFNRRRRTPPGSIYFWLYVTVLVLVCDKACALARRGKSIGQTA